MENYIVFVSVIALIWGILNIILFFKIWGMTDDVRKLTNKCCVTSDNESKVSNSITGNNQNSEDADYDRRLDNVNSGDSVRRKSDGKIMEVDSVEEKRLFCKGGSLEGYKWYPKSSVEYLDK